MSGNPYVGMGCMRLSTDADFSEEDAISTILAGLGAGVSLLNTAASYGRTDRDGHRNETLIASALSRSDAAATVVTKCGMRRPRGGWRPDGRRNQILKDAEQSIRALGKGPLDALLLHAPDPGTDFGTSVRALRTAKESGLAKQVGLSNIRLDQLRRASDIVEIDWVEVAVSPFDEDAVRGGVVRHCLEHGIEVLAHSPLGGPKRHASLSANEELQWLASAHQVSAQTIVLAWLYGLGLVPIPGARRPETARGAAQAARLQLRDDETALLDELFHNGPLLRTSPESRRPTHPRGEVVVLVGLPAAGKTSAAEQLATDGFERLSRDERGGSLAELSRELDVRLRAGSRRLLMDATYPTRAQRNRVIEAAWQHGAAARCIWFDTSLGQAQINAVARMVERYGKVLTPAEMKAARRSDPNAFDPRAQHRYVDNFEVPDAAEGWAEVDRRPFHPRPFGDRSGVVVDFEVFGAEQKRGDRNRGWLECNVPMLVLGWFPEVERGGVTEDDVRSRFESLGCDAEFAFCPHVPGPPKCWCRKPYPGLVVPWLQVNRIGSITYYGTSSASAKLAQTLGAAFVKV